MKEIMEIIAVAVTVNIIMTLRKEKMGRKTRINESTCSAAVE